MKKYIAAMLIVFSLLLAFSACEGNRDKDSDDQSTTVTTGDDAPLQTGDGESEDEGDWIPKFY